MEVASSFDEFEQSIKYHFGSTMVSIVVSNGESAFLSIWKNPSLDASNDDTLSTMRYLPLFYVICSFDKEKKTTLKLITHHGKVVDTWSMKENQAGSELNEAEKLKFVEKLTKMKMCPGVESSDFVNGPHLIEQLEQNVIIRSRQCKFALFEGVVCDSCQKLNQNKRTKSKSNTRQRTRSENRNTVTNPANLYTNVDPKATVRLELQEEFTKNKDKVNSILEVDTYELPENVLLTELEWDYDGQNDDITCFEEDSSHIQKNSAMKGKNTSDMPLEREVSLSLQAKESQYDCDRCVSNCSTRSQLRKHTDCVHKTYVISKNGGNTKTKNSEFDKNNKTNIHSSQECNFKYTKKSRIEEVCNKSKPLTCQHCDENFSTKAELNKHLRHIHLQEQQRGTTNKEFKCPSCDFVTSRKTGLTDHVNAVHDKVKPYMCQHCSHTFASNGNLTQHIHAVHDKLRPFICQYCTYATSSQPNLRKHIKAVHHKIRDFKCSTCPFDAASKQLLDRHVQAVHEKIKSYKCKYCQYECAKGYNMKVHIRHVHEKLKGYKCQQCSFEATRKGKLTDHVLSCHGVGANNVVDDNVVETIIVQSEIESHAVLVD